MQYPLRRRVCEVEITYKTLEKHKIICNIRSDEGCARLKIHIKRKKSTNLYAISTSAKDVRG